MALYYRRFSVVLGNPLSRIYHRWAYKKALADANGLNQKLNFSKRRLTCLLCGVGHENTADEFISFISSKSRRAKIIIIDKGDEQIDAVKALVCKKYGNLDIDVKKLDALDLARFIAPGTVDWIETDGFVQFFDHGSLKRLLRTWKKILSESGAISFRDCFCQGRLDWLIDGLRIKLAKHWLNIDVYSHSLEMFESSLRIAGFRFKSKKLIFPTFMRYILVNARK